MTRTDWRARRPSGRRLGAVFAILLGLLGAGTFSNTAPVGAQAQNEAANADNPNKPPPVPPSDKSKGKNYDGLESSPACPHAYKVKGTDTCTHGPDVPPDYDPNREPAPVAPAEPSAPEYATEEEAAAANGAPAGRSSDPTAADSGAPSAVCNGLANGVARRTQVMYVRAADRPNRYSTYVNSIKTWAQDADNIYNNSAVQTGGTRRIRFITDSACVPTVLSVQIPNTGDDNLSNTVAALQALGHNRSDRVYMLFVDAGVYCGIGNWDGDNQPGSNNGSNVGPAYGRTDFSCWGGPVVAHEHMHNMGGVNPTSPNHSGFAHCTDEFDRMCYSDEPFFPPMTIVCPTSTNENIFDCNHDDYFSTRATNGSYLTSHWNAANNLFLIGNSGRYRYDLDYDGDGRKDEAIYRPSVPNQTSSQWWIRKSNNGATAVFNFGLPGDRVGHGEFDGDGQADTINYRPSTSQFFVVNSSCLCFHTRTLNSFTGSFGDILTPGDYDRDGLTDISVYRPSTRTWYVKYTATGTQITKVLSLAVAGDIPVPHDYDDDDRTDMAVWRPSNGTWFIYNSYNGAIGIHQWGFNGDRPVPGDHDGDGRADLTVWRPSNGTWYVTKSSDALVTTRQWGVSGDTPIRGANYDGDNKADFSVYRPSSGTWFTVRSTDNSTYSVPWGQTGDIPVA